MRPSSKRIMFILLSLALLLGAAFVYSSLIRDAYDSVAALRSELISKTDSLNRTQETLTRVQSLLNSLQNAPEVQKRAELILPNSKDIGYLASQVIGLAKINGLGLESLSTQIAPIQPSKSNIVRNVGRLKAESRLGGSYSGFKAFLRQLEDNILLLDVSDLRVESYQAKGEAPTLNYAVSITSYYQAE
ncbi:MAG: hypothetical protein UV58_C0007G0034 [Candidatus Wolfebacteria bacterium GW2011_GWC1_43_10]|uniref:Uncharacterized protein n=2 Tax=Candidatus Wolfeibacteriota TaxID=1752735 RepID=A0A0G1F759_9BACT|nr:MAG: hypothetical protein UV58_C0007G0034 [Candidatus Wolfebacteria bacterium GW2011_GWC1_43_10]KKT22515.1 MAG: hypothetical protein UW08_C0007G0011 [Parcubacteria group bacterium GW2011_GWB1_43_8b]